VTSGGPRRRHDHPASLAVQNSLAAAPAAQATTHRQRLALDAHLGSRLQPTRPVNVDLVLGSSARRSLEARPTNFSQLELHAVPVQNKHKHNAVHLIKTMIILLKRLIVRIRIAAGCGVRTRLTAVRKSNNNNDTIFTVSGASQGFYSAFLVRGVRKF